MKVIARIAPMKNLRSVSINNYGFKALMLLCCLCTLSFSASAVTKTSVAAGGVWSTPATWVGGVVPGLNDDVIIANGATVTVTATPLAAINSLTVGQGTNGVLNFTVAAAGITVNGTTTVSATAQLINSTVATATRQFGTLIVNGTWNCSVASPISISGDITVNTGATFTSGTGLYTLSGTTQSIGGSIASLSISNIILSGTVTNNSTNLIVATGIAGAGNFIMGSGSTLTYAPATAIGVTTLNATTNTPNTIVYSSVTTAIVRSMTYSNLTSSTTGVATVAAGGITINGNLSVTSGTLSDGGTQIIGNSTGSVIMTGTANLQIGIGTATTETFPTLFPTANVSLAPTTTVTYNIITNPQSIAALTYGNLTLSGAGTKSLTGNTIVAGNLTTASTFAFAGYQLSVAGNFTNTGTLSAATTGSELVMNGTTASTLNVGTLPAGGQIYNLTINKTAGITVSQLTNVITVNNNITLTSGNFTQVAAVTATAALNIGAGSTWTTAGFALTSSTATTVSGTLAITGTGAKALGAVTINSGGAINNTVAATSITATSLNIAAGGTWSITAVTPITISGDLTNAGTFTNTGAINYSLAGNITNDGSFTPGTGTYTLTGAGRTISTTNGSALTLGTVLINGTGTYTLSSAYISPNIFTISSALTIAAAANTFTVNGYLSTPSVTFTTGGTLTNNDTVSISTTLTGGSGTFVNAATGTLYFGGVSIGSAFTISSTGNTVVYNGGAVQTIRSSISYYNLVIAKTTGTVASLNAATIARNNITVLSGTFSDGGFQLTGNATGIFSVAAGATMQYGVGGATATTIPTLYTTANVSLSPTSTVIYNGTSAVTISAVPATYGHLTLSAASIKTAGSAHIIQGNLTINAGTFADAGNTITVNGSILNSGTHSGTGKILLTGGTVAHAITTAGTGIYANLELNDAAGATLTGNATITNTLTLTSGSLAAGTGILSFTGTAAAIAGTGTNLTTTTGTSLNFSTTATGLYIPSSVSDLAALTVAIGTTNTLTTNSDITLNAATSLTLTSGRTDIGSHKLTLTGTLSGTPSVTNCILADAAAGGQVLKVFPLAVPTTFTFPIADNTGTVEYSPVILTAFTPLGAAQTIGVNVTDNTHPQINSNLTQTNYITRYWTFTESGAATSYSYTGLTLTYLAADNIGTLNATNDQINRYDGSWSTLNSTISTTTAVATGTNTNVTGTLGGNDYTVRLNVQGVYTWNNTAGGLWTTPGNWTPTRNTPANSDVLIFDGSVTPGTITVTAVPVQTIGQLQVINGVDVNLQSATTATTLTCGYTAGSNVLTVDAASKLELSSTGTNVLSLAFPALATLSTDVEGTIVINANTGLTNSIAFTNLLAANNTINGTITNNGGAVTSTALTTLFGAGSFYNHNRNGGVIPTATWNATSTVTVTGITATNPTGLTGTFGNFIWNNPAQAVTGIINGAMTIAGDLTVTAGILNFNALVVSVGGNVVNTGTITTSSVGSTLNLNGTAAQTVSGSGTWTTGTPGKILNLTINNAAGVTFTPAITIQTALTLTAGTLTATALTIGVPALAVTTTRGTGSLANIPTFGYTSGAYAITYTAASTTYSTLNELPPATTPTNGVLSITGAGSTVIQDKDASIGTLTTAAGTTFNLNGNILSLTLGTPTSNTGIITANAAGSTIRLAGTVAQNYLTSATTFTGSFVSALVIDNSAATGVILGAQSAALGFGDVTINTGRLFNLGTVGIKIAGAYTNNGTITANGAGASITLNGTSPQTFAIGTYTSSLLSNFIVNNISGVTLAAPLNVSTVFTLTNGILTTTNTNLLTITSTAVTGIVGGTTANYVKGPLARTLPASSSAVATYSFPIGKSDYNLMELINPTTGTGVIVVKAEVMDALAGGTDGVGFNSSPYPVRYWQTTVTGNLTSGGTVHLYDNAMTLTSDNLIGTAPTLTGTYASIGGTNINSPTPGNITSTGALPGTSGFIRVGSKACLSGNYTIGATGADFTNISRAISTLNSAYVCSDLKFELTSTYVGTSETFPLTINPVAYTGGPWNITFRPAAGVAATTAGNPGTGINFFNLNAADYITFDGRAGGVGSTSAWTVRNTQTAATFTPTFQFINDASNDTLKYLTIESQNALASSGTIYIGTATTTGNDNILIDNNTIRDRSDATGYPLNAIYATGTALKMNENVTISNNRIFNFWSATAATAGINIQANNSDFNITGNSFYQTASRVQTTGAAHAGIIVNSTVGNNFNISDNYIGGTAANAGGTAWTVTGAVANTFIGINLNLGSTTASSIQNNTVTNMAWSCSLNSAVQPGIFTGIYMLNGAANIGDIAGNTIGASTGTGAITITNGAAGGNAYGIVDMSGNGTINISNNSLGSITVQGTAATINTNFTGIQFAGGTGTTPKVIAGNTVGSTTTPNSINLITAANPATAQSVTGITFTSGAGGVLQLQNNIVANLNNNYIGTGAGLTTGILIATIPNAASITGNTVYNLSSTSPTAGTGAAASVLGISLASTIAGHSIANNTVYGLSNTTASAAVSVTGLSYTGSSTTAINANLVHSLTASSAASIINGIYLGAGTSTVSNNMIRLGINSAGSSITSNQTINGINDIATTNSIYFNSVYIGGAGVASGSSNTYAYYGTATTGARAIQDNILWNERTNSGGTGKHYAIRIGAITGLTSNYNDLLSGAVLGQTGAADYPSLTAWQGQSGTPDMASISGDPQFISRTGNAATVDLHISPSTPTPIEASGLAIGSVTTDFDGQSRAGLTPTDMGADAGNFIYIDLTPPVIGPITAANTCNNVSTYTISGVTITDATGVDVSTTYKPRLYYKKSTAANTAAGWSYVQASNSTSPFSFDLNFSLIGGVSPADIIQYFVVTQDIATAINVGTSGSGTYATAPTSVALGASAFPIGGTLSTFSILPCQGTVNVGSTEVYTGLTPNGGIFQTINSLPAGLTGDLTISITSDIAVENGVNALTNAKLNGYKVRIVPSAGAARTISNVSALGVPMIPFNGALGVTIDGSFAGSGRFLRFRNTHTTPTTTFPVIQYYGNTSADTLSNAIIESNETGTATGAVVIGTGTNTGVVISGNIITSATGGTTGNPANGFYCNGATTSACIIAGNNFENCSNAGILLGTSVSSNWTLTQNNFYQSVTSTLAQSAISVGGGGGHIISRNIIGGSAAGATGTWTNSGAVAVSGIVLATLSTSVPTIVDSNVIKNISMSGTSTGSVIGINAASGAYQIGSAHGNTISNITNAGTGVTYGIQCAPVGAIIAVSGNSISSLVNTNSGVTTVKGIYSTGASTSNIFKANLIYNLVAGSNVSGVIAGIDISGGGIVANNMIRLGYDASGAPITTTSIISGITKTSTSTTFIWHNSVYIGGSGVGTTASTTAAFRRTTAAADDIRDNIFVNARSNSSTGGAHYAYLLNAGTPLTSDRNIFYVSGTGGALFSLNNGTSSLSTLQAWNAGTSGQDLGSGIGDPNYAAPASATPDLHVVSPSPAEAAGINIPSITDDFDGDIRASNTPVDIGADAINVTPVDIFRPTIALAGVATFTTSCGGGVSTTITATVTDAGTGATAAALWYRRLSPSTTPWSYFSGSLTSGTANNGTWSFPVSIPGAVNSEIYQAYLVVGDGAPTPNLGYAPYDATTPVHSSVTTQVTAPTTPYFIPTSLGSPLSGTVTVGSGGNYATFNGAAGLFSAINNFGLSGNLTVTVISDITETTTTPLNQISNPCGGGPYAILIQPDGTTKRTITGAINTNFGLISYNGADSVTVDGQYAGDGLQHLHFKNTSSNYAGTSYNATFYMYNDATNNTITNTIVEGLAKGQISGVLNSGVVMLGTGASSGNSYNTFSNNLITGTLSGGGADASTCLLFSQGSAAAPNANNTILNNNFKDFAVYSTRMGDNWFSDVNNRCYGVYVTPTGNGSNWTISGNSFYTTFPENHGTFTALGFIPGSASSNNVISGNYIGGSAPQCGMGTGAFKMMGSTYAINYAEVRNEGITVNAANASITGNTIKRIYLTSGYYSGFVGIDVSGSTAATVSRNTIGGTLSNYTDNTNSVGTDIIQVNGGSIVGFGYPGYIYGIWTVGSVSLICDSNNFNVMLQAGASYGGSVQCLLHQSSGGFVITNNTNATYAQQCAGINLNAFAMRIEPTASSSGNRIENNRLSTVKVSVAGSAQANSTAVYVNIGPGNQVCIVNGVIKNNRINDNTNVENSGYNEGIILSGNANGNGTWDITNNMIYMNNGGAVNRMSLYGMDIEMNSASVTNVLYNSIWVAGSHNTNTGVSNDGYALIRYPNSTDVFNVKNNILINTRSGGNALTSFGAISNHAGATGWTSDYNFLMATSTGRNILGYFNGASYSTFANWQASTGQDSHSYSATYNATTTNFATTTLNPANLFTSVAGADLHIAYSNGTSAYQFVDSRAQANTVLTDIDNETRDVSTPDIGADEFNTCTKIAITAQPVSQTLCAGGNVKFGVKNTGASPYTYQWQISADHGTSWSVLTISSPYTTNTAGDTLSITGVTSALDSNLYRVKISNLCGDSTSTGALLHINSAPDVTWESPTSHINNVCVGSLTQFAVKGLRGTSFTWQVSADTGATWNVVNAGAPYALSQYSDTSYLSINTVASLNGKTYRCIVSNACGMDTSSIGTLIVQSVPVDTIGLDTVSVCAGSAGTFTTGGTGVATWAWQYYNGSAWTTVSSGTPAGATYSGASTSSLVISTTGATAPGYYLYRAQLNSLCGTSYSDTATLNVMNASSNAYLATVSDSLLVETCPDGTWTYYSTRSEPKHWLFAIQKNGNSFSATPKLTMRFTTPTAYDSVANASASKALYTMNRHWNVTIDAGSLDSTVGTVSVRFFYNPADTLAMMNAAKAWALSHPTSLSGYTTKAHSVEWFKTRGIQYAPANNTVSSVPTSYTFTQANYSYGMINDVNYVELKNITSFSGGTAAIRVSPTPGAPVALPVKLLYLTATDVEDKYIRLDWATASEINNSGFDIERSTDGVSFAKIGWMAGHGTTNTLISYTLPDHDVAADVIYYYRLKQIDVDGQFTYSEIVSASIAGAGITIGELIPNPTASSTHVNIYSSSLQPASLQVYNVTGQIVRSLEQPIYPGTNAIDLNVADLASGIYTVNIHVGDQHTARRLVVR